mmetsp:Transcript_11382/g.47628  ORF Transcript_11382/g.47628 Transcript_11382/m.47628 type:complete len:337 (+) Transcript_11382:193-1203(+)
MESASSTWRQRPRPSPQAPPGAAAVGLRSASARRWPGAPHPRGEGGACRARRPRRTARSPRWVARWLMWKRGPRRPRLWQGRRRLPQRRRLQWQRRRVRRRRLQRQRLCPWRRPPPPPSCLRVRARPMRQRRTRARARARRPRTTMRQAFAAMAMPATTAGCLSTTARSFKPRRPPLTRCAAGAPTTPCLRIPTTTSGRWTWTRAPTQRPTQRRKCTAAARHSACRRLRNTPRRRMRSSARARRPCPKGRPRRRKRRTTLCFARFASMRCHTRSFRWSRDACTHTASAASSTGRASRQGTTTTRRCLARPARCLSNTCSPGARWTAPLGTSSARSR